MINWALHTLPFLLTGDDETVVKTLPILSGAAEMPHGNGKLLSHLCGTGRILAAERASATVVGAGLFHSIYSTEFYPYRALSMELRTDVSSIIGEAAENLVHLFCTIQRRSLWVSLEAGEELCRCVDLSGHPVAIPKRAARDLLQIECANIIEQSCTMEGAPHAFMAWYLSSTPATPVRFSPFAPKRRTFTEHEEIAAIKYYETFLSDPCVASRELLLSALELNPFSFELEFFSALTDRELGDPVSASRRINRAETLLETWGTPWDKRLTFNGWKRLIAQAKCESSALEAAKLSGAALSLLTSRALSLEETH